MQLAMLSVACLASAAEAGASLSLRGGRSLSEVVENVTQSEETSSHSAVAGEMLSADLATSMPIPNQTAISEANVSETAFLSADLATFDFMPIPNQTAISKGDGAEVALEPHLLSSVGWSKGGDKMWGRGTGIESITHFNVGYYNQGMDAAHARCGDAHCALMINPPGHRTVNRIHIHFVHYASYGSHLKHRLESQVCRRAGWHGGAPCGGKAAYFPGFPAVFSAAMSGGSIKHAMVIAWPKSCGGRGTIVEVAYDCSLEHQIRGDYNPRYR